ncbi:MAG: molybdate ABC transporter substrate-binding protein [Halieaceae bacterium]|nr:molybdate ABC transporter substrate-binding protein [Halieaceae bacterium]
MRQLFSCNKRHGGKCGLGILLILLLPPAACGAALQVAVASNFRTTLEQLAPDFNRGQAEDIKVSSGSSGMLYAQIVHGAPFDVFLSADSSYPRRLEQDGLAVHRRTYARGILVLVYQPELAELAQSGAGAILSRPGLSLAIANPRLAPYGIAAQQVLERLGSTPSPLLRGANISQAYQMWSSGGADAALIARSQAQPPWLDLPREWYGDIQQQAVLLRRTPNLSKARDFLQWLLSPAIQAAIAGAGFNPGVNTHE